MRWLGASLFALLLLAPVAGQAADEVRYDVEISGAIAKSLRDDLEASSDLVKLKDRPPASEALLRRRAETDAARLKQVVEAAGYRAATVEYTVDAGQSPAKVTLKVEPGPLYRIERVTLSTPQVAPPPVVGRAPLESLALGAGAPATSGAVLAAEPRIVEALTRRGYPQAKVTGRKVVVDHGTRSMTVDYTVVQGPLASFGPTTIGGLEGLDIGYVERRIAWRRGQPFDSDVVEETRKALVDSGLFAVVRIDPAAEVTPTGELAMALQLTERLPRSVGGGLSYDTSLGFGAKAFWEHRNLFGSGEKLRFSTELAESRLGGLAEYRVSDLFGRKEQSFIGAAEIAKDVPVAYTAERQRLSAGIEHRLDRTLTAGVGIQAEHGDVTEEARQLKQTYRLFGIPLSLKRDATDDLLNPSEGSRLNATLTSYTSASGPELTFFAARIGGSAYRALDDAGRYTLAVFGALGTVVGEPRDTLPADKRLYAGGGGSLRGYGYQLAGPLGPDNKPLGGRSLIELGGELRIKITDTIGIVPFFEAGNVYRQNLPDPSGGLLYDAGLGVRYYTPIGPVRLDLATPLKRRPGDGVVQVYISIGQAF